MVSALVLVLLAGCQQVVRVAPNDFFVRFGGRRVLYVHEMPPMSSHLLLGGFDHGQPPAGRRTPGGNHAP